MNIFRLISAAMMLAAVVTISTSAQTRRGAVKPAGPKLPATTNVSAVPDSRIAFVDTGVFGDEKAGIITYVTAIKGLEREFEPRQIEMNNIQSRINVIIEELNKLTKTAGADPKTITAKQDEGGRLQKDLKLKKEQAEADVTKRYQEVVGPISTEIGKALDRFAAQRGISVIFDVSKLTQAILTINPAMDMTKDFIAEYNTSHPAR